MSFNQPVAPLLSEADLALRSQLPLKPAAAALTGRFITLAPASIEEHLPALWRLSNGAAIAEAGWQYPAYDADELIWRYLHSGPITTGNDQSIALQAEIEAPDRRALAVIHRESGLPVGVVSLMNNVPAFLRIELGGIWYSPVVQRTPANLEATYLLLAHCFALGYRRVEWKCDDRNERSKRSALRMGFTFEGIQQQHMIIKNRSRDTAWFRILSGEWFAVKQRLEEMLYGRC
jgi:RimJ/RimL family protein N-acetyltransferase